MSSIQVKHESHAYNLLQGTLTVLSSLAMHKYTHYDQGGEFRQDGGLSTRTLLCF